MSKRGIGVDVLTAARERIAYTFEFFPRVYLSFSGGKDSTVMLHLVADEARKRGRRFGLLIVDLEAQYRLTIEHIERMIDEYADCIDLYWVALPIALRNAVSVYEPKWLCWEPGKAWVRQPDPRSITDEREFPFFTRGMEFEEFVPAFGEWYSKRLPCACFVGIRSDESLNRWRTIASSKKERFAGKCWTTHLRGTTVYNIYPIYDWRTEDVWTYHAKTGRGYNRLYDLMHQAGLTIHQARICQPYGDDQRKGLWLYQVIEPETWARIVARVNGANSGAEFVQFSGNSSGTIRISKPDGHSWESFCSMLLASMPTAMREHYEAKIHTFIAWYGRKDSQYAYGIPDEADPALEAARKAPSWRRIAKMLLRNDYWAKGLSFSQQNDKRDSFHYRRYIERKKREQQEWKNRRLHPSTQ